MVGWGLGEFWCEAAFGVVLRRCQIVAYWAPKCGVGHVVGHFWLFFWNMFWDPTFPLQALGGRFWSVFYMMHHTGFSPLPSITQGKTLHPLWEPKNLLGEPEILLSLHPANYFLFLCDPFLQWAGGKHPWPRAAHVGCGCCYKAGCFDNIIFLPWSQGEEKLWLVEPSTRSCWSVCAVYIVASCRYFSKLRTN